VHRTTVFHAGAYRGLSDVAWATPGWVDWDNNRRLHSGLDYMTRKSSSKRTMRRSGESRKLVHERQRTWVASVRVAARSPSGWLAATQFPRVDSWTRPRFI
jgi:hypothetical protein